MVAKFFWCHRHLWVRPDSPSASFVFNSSNGLSVDLARQCHLQSFAWVPRWQAGSNRWLLNWGATTCLSTRLGDGMLDGGNSIWSNFTQDLKVEVLSFDDFANKFLCVFERIWPMGNNLHLANCETPRRVKLTWPDNLTQVLVPWWIHTWRIPCMGTSEHNHTIIISQFFAQKHWTFKKNVQGLQDDLKISRDLDVSVNRVCFAQCTPDSTGPRKYETQAKRQVRAFQISNSGLCIAWNDAFMFSKDALETVNDLCEGGYSLGKFLPGLCILPWRLYAARQSLGQIQVRDMTDMELGLLADLQHVFSGFLFPFLWLLEDELSDLYLIWICLYVFYIFMIFVAQGCFVSEKIAIYNI